MCEDNEKYMKLWLNSNRQKFAESELLAKTNLLESIASWIQGQRLGRSKVEIDFCDMGHSSFGDRNGGVKPLPLLPDDHVVKPQPLPNDNKNAAEEDDTFDGTFASWLEPSIDPRF